MLCVNENVTSGLPPRRAVPVLVAGLSRTTCQPAANTTIVCRRQKNREQPEAVRGSSRHTKLPSIRPALRAQSQEFAPSARAPRRLRE